MKKLFKSTTDKKLSGVLGGISNRFDIDSTLVRIGFILMAVFTAVVPCVIAYFLASWVMPNDMEIN